MLTDNDGVGLESVEQRSKSQSSVTVLCSLEQCHRVAGDGTGAQLIEPCSSQSVRGQCFPRGSGCLFLELVARVELSCSVSALQRVYQR